MNINEIAKQTLILLKERGLKPTPENYSEVFEELSFKKGLSGGTKEKIEKYKNLLIPYYQTEFKNRHIKNIDELLSSLISRLNRQASENKVETFELLRTVMKSCLVSKDKKIREIASSTLDRISRSIDSEASFLLEKKWQEFEKNYNDEELDEELRKYGIRNDDFRSTIKKLLNLLENRSLKYFAELISHCLNPSLTQSLMIDGFIKQLEEKPHIVNSKDFENTLSNMVNKRIATDMLFVQKNLNFFDQNLHKLNQMLDLLQNLNQENLDFVNSLEQEDGKVVLSFQSLNDKFQALNERISLINDQLRQTSDEKQRENWNLTTEIAKLDENYFAYDINYSLCIFRMSNYHIIMQKYGLANLNEIFSRFKKILQDNCSNFDDLWILDEKSYLIILRGKSYEEIIEFIQKNVNALENYKFIYKQEVVLPKVQSFFMDKKSYPHLNILNEILEKLPKDVINYTDE